MPAKIIDQMYSKHDVKINRGTHIELQYVVYISWNRSNSSQELEKLNRLVSPRLQVNIANTEEYTQTELKKISYGKSATI